MTPLKNHRMNFPSHESVECSKDRAVMVAETVSEVIRGKAQEVTEKFDQTIEREVQSHAGISLLLLLRDIAMGLAPLAILVLLQQYW